MWIFGNDDRQKESSVTMDNPYTLKARFTPKARFISARGFGVLIFRNRLVF